MIQMAKRFFAAAAVALMAGFMSAPIAMAAPAEVSEVGAKNLERLNSCIATKKNADLLLVMDESASLKGHDGKAASDPNNVRVAAASDLITHLGQSAQDSGAAINVKLAGFGESYRSDPKTYGEWVNIATDADKLSQPIQGFKDRNNDLYTNYGLALDGAYSEFAGRDNADSCRFILFFTDGLLTVPGDHQADLDARAGICAAAGQVTKLRETDIQLFTVGLIPDGEESPEQLLRSMAEGSDCAGGSTANGAFFNAESNPAALFAAFRSLLPDAGSTEHTGDSTSQMKFVLDDSITEVQISAVPNTSESDPRLEPVLINPAGDMIDLPEGESTTGDTQLNVTTADSVLGMVDIRMVKEESGRWAGQWAFGYRSPENSSATYHAKMQILPGLNTQVAELTEKDVVGLSNDEQLTVTLVDRKGNTPKLAGEANLSAVFAPADGSAPIELGSAQSIAGGNAVKIPLSAVEKAATGELTLTTQITTKGTGDVPGTQLSPLVTRYPIAITPSNMPKVAGEVAIELEQESTVINIPVEGPGKLWIEPSQLKPEMTLPESAGMVTLETPHGSSGTAVELDKGETAELPITVRVDQLADGPIAFDLPVTLHAADGSATEEVPVAMTGTMRVPVNAPIFVGVLIAALLLGILIPLAILYLIKYLTGVLVKTKLHALTLPVVIKDGQVIREDNGQPVVLDYQTVVLNTAGVIPNGRSVVLNGQEFNVRYGINPFRTPSAVAAEAPSISHTGKRYKKAACLPLAMKNSWVLYSNPQDKTRGGVLVIADSNVKEETLQKMAADISTHVPDYLKRLQETQPVVSPAAPMPQPGMQPQPGAQPQPAPDPFGAAPGMQPQPAQDPFGAPASPPNAPSPQPPQGQGQGQGQGPFGPSPSAPPQQADPFGAPGNPPNTGGVQPFPQPPTGNPFGKDTQT